MNNTEFTMLGLGEDGRVTYFVRDWSKYDATTRTIPEWEEHSYDWNDPALVAIREEIGRLKGEIKTMTQIMLEDESQ